MELSKRLIEYKNHTEIVWCSKFESRIIRNSYLIGFKESIPVLTTENVANMSSKSSGNNIVIKKKNFKVEINTSGEKFIMFNGKKLKVIAESEVGHCFLKKSSVTGVIEKNTLTNSKHEKDVLKRNIVGTSDEPTSKIIKINTPQDSSVEKNILTDSTVSNQLQKNRSLTSQNLLPKIIKISAPQTLKPDKNVLTESKLSNDTSVTSTSSNSIPKIIKIRTPQQLNVESNNTITNSTNSDGLSTETCIISTSKDSIPSFIKISSYKKSDDGKNKGTVSLSTPLNNATQKVIRISVKNLSKEENTVADSKLSNDLLKNATLLTTSTNSSKTNLMQISAPQNSEDEKNISKSNNYSIPRTIKINPNNLLHENVSIESPSIMLKTPNTSNNSISKIIKISKPQLKKVEEDCQQSKIKNLSIKVDKNIMSQISNQTPINENTVFNTNVVSLTGNSKASTTDNTVICTDKSNMLQSKFTKPIPMINNIYIPPISQNYVESVALDLTKNCESQTVKTPAKMMKDQCIQVDIKPKTISIEVNTDITGDLPENNDELESLMRLDFRDDFILPSPITEKCLNLFDVFEATGKSMEDNDFTTLTTAVPGKSLQSYSESSISTARNLFVELRQALVVDDQGNLPIHIGVITNNLKLVKRNLFLLKVLKQSVDIQNSHDYSPLQLALIHNSSIEIISCILANGGSCHTMDSDGNNIIHLAVESERKEALKLLVSYAGPQRCNLDQFNHEGLTPLMICCLNNYQECAETLLDADADPNLKDQISGRTALFHAAEKHNVSLVEKLLSFNANTKIKNFFGTSPHDAMYELEGVPEPIKYMILGKNNKRKSLDDTGRGSKQTKTSESAPNGVKTYSRSKTLHTNSVLKTYTTVK